MSTNVFRPDLTRGGKRAIDVKVDCGRPEQTSGVRHRLHLVVGLAEEQFFLAMVKRQLFHVYEVVQFPLAMKERLVHRKCAEMDAEVYVPAVTVTRQKYQLEVSTSL